MDAWTYICYVTLHLIYGYLVDTCMERSYVVDLLASPIDCLSRR
jgi:hypothetical protein